MRRQPTHHPSRKSPGAHQPSRKSLTADLHRKKPGKHTPFYCKEACLPGVFFLLSSACADMPASAEPTVILQFLVSAVNRQKIASARHRPASAFHLCRRCVLILYLHDLGLFRRIRRIPSPGGHFLINFFLHGDTIV